MAMPAVVLYLIDLRRDLLLFEDEVL